MEILSRLLQCALRENMIKGVRVAHTSLQITHAMYADDLVIMGDVGEEEVYALQTVLHKFAKASGLCINPHKSRLWFSKACATHEVIRVQMAWCAREVEGEEKYLGIVLSTKGDTKRNGILLLEKIKSKLTGWKSNLLSYAGRLVLIKAVLMSLPVYAMALEMLPKGIIKDINRIIAKFFWGKTNQNRYMAMVGWQRICKPFEEGGLGVKDLEKFGEALFQKVVWSLMADEEKLWVRVCKSKYYPLVGFWRAQKSGGSSKLWGQVLKKREFFADQVRWRLGNGQKANALSQPWFATWSVQQLATQTDRKLKVCSLLEENTGEWNIQEISRLFQPNQVQSIVMETTKPNPQSEEDKLLWLKTRTGRYTVKEGYKELIQGGNQVSINQTVDWNLLWKCNSITPKVKLFLWRLLNKGLPLGVNMHTRITSFSPTCQRCHEENEYEMHCLFFCQTSRQVWFGSPLGIRVHELPLNIARTVSQIMGSLDDDGKRLFAVTMWELWKERNKTVIEHKPFKPPEVLQRVRALWGPCNEYMLPVHPKPQRSEKDKYEYNSMGWQVIMDASWDTSNSAGGAFLVYEKGLLHSIGMHCFQVQDPFHAEATILREAVKHMYETLQLPNNTKVQFFSDCLNLVTSVNQGEYMDLPAWRAERMIRELVSQMEERGAGMTLQHVQRPAVRQAHDLANTARRRRINYQGPLNMAPQQESTVLLVMDDNFYQRVLEAPP
ncbi:RNA-directed DNA polymerase (reverse transcriptase)-related family protein [Rhynchospora pubera]|uniref:RNA-directed DNA polymerase (Reverse transcriptase)-related family protein n=1 Tax=Rhynchospora pubera TaxID=906938 RepID=A0AAV8H6W3_9POAL|nr:RNA-directed DNA polymerase (reverse transcriptase)-related family protein [Rhynchospora pubera]